MDTALLEGLAVATYERVDADPSEPLTMFALAQRLYGPRTLMRSMMMNAPAATFVLNGQRHIALRRGLPVARAHFFVSHEIAHGLLAELGHHDERIEEACDFLGAALLAPQPAVRRLRFAFGDDYREIAQAVCATETWAALRVAEVTGRPTAVIAPRSVRVRGQAWTWPSESQIRNLARVPRLPGVCRARLRDEPGRIVLVADENAA